MRAGRALHLDSSPISIHSSRLCLRGHVETQVASVSYCRVTNYPRTSWLNIVINLYHFTLSVGQESEGGLAPDLAAPSLARFRGCSEAVGQAGGAAPRMGPCCGCGIRPLVWPWNLSFLICKAGRL